ncbi:MAG: methylmalonyl Co-A mutase-associated GTPase MeaB [Candidatus Bathyarchaeota archaeon]|nr:MAG: methylmalonyl Co-A mutase-associated GTPase MeaB [Candidatus Bathyarchaeota archaeon]
MRTTKQLVDAVVNGEPRSIARAITLVENGSLEAQEISSRLFPHLGKAHVIGITGPSGAGKSTLVEKLVRKYRERSRTVGVVAVDPTSPFSGGAFLGDRIRMQDLSTDTGVFIRSMATRHNPGGLAKATKDTVRILDASGKDIVIVETVGAGQSEVEIMKIAQTIVVVLAPGLGDEIQAIKAGMMEIGDIFVINKADRENANKAATDIQSMLELSSEKHQWKPAIVKTIALTGEGTIQLSEKIDEHRKYLEKGEGKIRQQRILEAELMEAIRQKAAERIIQELKKSGRFSMLISRILRKELDPLTAAEKVLGERMNKG